MVAICNTVFRSNNSSPSSEALEEDTMNERYQRNQRRKRNICTCTSTQKINKPLASKAALIPSLKFGLNLQSLSHESSCPLSKSFSKTTVVTVAFEYCGALLARAIRASITINKGAGGCFIGHRFDIARIVANDSPAFQLVNWTWDLHTGRIRSVSDFDAHLRNSIKEIECLFRKGHASPFDVNENGATLLHVRIRVMICAFQLIFADNLAHL